MDTFDEFYRDHHDTVRRGLVLILANTDRAEDLTQEAFARAWRHWRTVSSMEHPVAWLFTVALNDERKRWRREPRYGIPDRQTQHEPDPAGSVVTGLRLAEALRTVTARQRTAIVLRYFADLPVADVAAAMGCAEGTAKATLHQTLDRLRIALEDDHAD